MHTTLKLSLLGVALATASGMALAQGQVNVYNWSDYVAEDTISNFEQRTGIRVSYDVYDSNEVLEAVVLAGSSGYDVVVPTGSNMARQIQAGAYQRLDKSLLPNYENLDSALLESLQTYDPNQEYSVPYQWGTTGIGYNAQMVEEILGEDAPIGSWDLVFDPQYASQLAECGISFLDSGDEMIPLALNYLGYDHNSHDTAEINEARDLLVQVAPHLTYLHSSRYISDLANGEICVAVGWSGDVFMAKWRAEEAGRDFDVNYYIPSEGTIAWADFMVIPVDAPNPENAHAFINYILDPEVSADISNYVWYGNPNLAAREFLDEDLLNDPGVFPEEGTNLFTMDVRPPAVERVVTRAWNAVRTAN
ncbi:polyamine ABC transporter substrate-binding protein [Natronospirillum operosum]|uniref:Putrescine-binding periplasmic protein n=1 Tax=Natronospirillum operosum TaxID=2759953 RepID=A0A4Z0WAL6_9GAMM|nr:polyamine ABC transporter substrate-binding protein [Natronospirillum operosum]TGG91451.1 polyamine ABC transporter substrate-binding protein [Natronospirillum operosum]